MIHHELVTLSDTTPTKLTPAGDVHSGFDLTLQNVNTEGYIYLGGANTVSSTDYGYRLSPSTAFSIELTGFDTLYAIADTDELSLAMLRANLEYGS